MKKITILTLLMLSGFGFAQFTTGTVTLTGSYGTAGTVKINTNSTTATITLTGVNTSWLGIGFGGAGNMTGVTDFFIWNATANRDYFALAPGGNGTPNADPTAQQSWTIVSDAVVGTVRTVVATRPLISPGDFTFTNDNSAIQIIFAQGLSTALGYHNGTPHNGLLLSRSSLTTENFSLNATAIYPNPSNGEFNVQTKTNLDKINIYSQTGQFVKTIDVTDKSNKVEVNVKGLSTGIYLIEFKNATEKSWKKVVVE